MADVVLIQPKLALDYDLACLPLGLLSISRYLYKENYKIKIINQMINNNWQKDLIYELKKNPICVGVSAMVGNSITCGLDASKIVKNVSDVPVVWGGPHPSILPRQTIENKFIDIVCEGEGDVTFYDLVKTLEKNTSLDKVKGIWYKKNDKIVKTVTPSPLDLNKLPDIPFNLVNLKDYTYTTWYKEKQFTINIETSKGCPFKCTYCYNPTVYPKWRALNSEKVLEMLKYIVEELKIKSIHFQDDNFFVDQKRTNKIMASIIKEKLDVVMGFQGIRVDSFCKMKKDEMDLLYKAGCKYINFGLETGSPRLLDFVNKGVTIDKVYDTNKRLLNYPDFFPYYNIMAGFPTETVEELLMTLRMSARLKKENPNVVIPTLFLFMPLPGTKIYDLSLEHGFIPPKNLEEWGMIRWTDSMNKGRINSQPWLSKEFLEMYRKILFNLHCADPNSIKKFSNPFFRNIAKICSPIAKFRFSNTAYKYMFLFSAVRFLNSN